MNEEQQYINFDEYVKASEPHKRERAEAWRVAIGLQAVDGLQTSEYLQETARRNIEGEITIDEARELVKQYYVTKTARDADDANKEEADKVSSNISKLLQTDAFSFSVATENFFSCLESCAGISPNMDATFSLNAPANLCMSAR